MAPRQRRKYRLGRQHGESRRTKKHFSELLARPAKNFPRKGEKLSSVPDKHGVYIIFDRIGRVLHVGRTYRGKAGLRQRLTNHLNGQSSFVRMFLKKNKQKLQKGYTFKYLQVGHARRRALLEHYSTGMLSPAHLGLGKSLKP